MNKYRVYSKDGRVERCRLTKVEYSGTFMGDRVVTSSFTSATEIAFDVFDYIEFRGEKFELEMIPTVKKVSSYQYEYDLRFVSLKYELERCMFRDFVPNDNEVVYPTPVTVEFTGKVNYLTERIQACLDRMYGAGVWSIVVSEGVDSEEKNLSLSNQNCWNALSLVNTEYKLNFHINGRTVVVGDSEAVQGVVFEYGKGNGLYEIERAADSDTGIVTKLIAYGGTRNLDYSYPKKPEWSDSVLPNTFILSPLRLMLPSFKKDGKTDYLLADDALIAKYGIREGVMMYDDIYPTITGATNSKGERIDKIAGVDAITDEETFDVYLNDLGFDLNDSLTTETPQLVMKTGALQGYAFNIKTIGALSNGGVRVTLEKNSIDNSDTGGYYIPNKDFNMSAGDEFVLLGILMPQLYIRNAEQRLEERAREYLNQYSTTNYSYSIGVDEIFMAKNPSVMAEVFEGKKMKINDDEIGINEELVTIQSLTIEDGDGLIPRIKVTLNNNPSASTLERIQGQIANIESTANSQYSAQTELAKQYQRKLNTSFFHRLFVAIDADGKEIAPNDTTTPIASVRVNYGLWTEQFLSAKGMNSGGGSDEPTTGATTLGGLRNVAADADSTYDVAKMLVLEAKSNLWTLKNLSDLVGGLDEAELDEYLTNNNYAKKSDIPSLDGYATEQWVLGKGYATTTDLDARIDALVNGAPAAYDTLKEIADVLAGNVNSISDILTALGNKADKATTLSGYGITDAYTIAQIDSIVTGLSGNISTLQGYFTDGVANSALRLSDNGSYTAWGQTFFTNGKPKSLSGALTDVTDITSSGTITTNKIVIGNGTIEWDEANKGFKVTGLYSTTYLSAMGANSSGGSSSGGGLITSLYRYADLGKTFSDTNNDTFNAYTINKINADLGSRISVLEGKATNVSFTQSLTSGTQIGSISIDGVAKNIYAPTIPTDDINKGVTAHGWGNHASVGYLTSASSLAWGKITGIPTTLGGYGITDWSVKGGDYDVNGRYDAGYYMIINGSNVPTRDSYGSLLVMPYRKASGNTTTDFATQIFLPNGDDSDYPNDMFFRTSLGSSWNAWQRVLTDNNYTSYTYSQSTIDTKLGGYLPLSGGTISGNLGITGHFRILSHFLFVRNNDYADWIVTDKEWQHEYSIIHSGNIGSQSVASATKLQTARKLWGQSFDGTADIIEPAEMILVRIKGIDGTRVGYVGRASATNNDLYVNSFSSNILFYTSSEERMRIASGGNVGIGTTSPQYKLDVNGDIAFSSASAKVGIEYGGGNTNLYNYIQFNVDAIKYYSGGWTSGNHAAHQFITGNQETRMVIMNSGNVLIGTATDSGYKLDVSGTLHASGAVSFDSVLAVGGATRIDGNVAIGNGSDGNKLYVYGVVRSAAYNAIGNNNAAFVFDKPGTNYTGIGANGVADTIYFGACNTSGAWITSYYQKWHFNGEVYAKTGVWSDGYVSAKGQNTTSDMRLKNVLGDVVLDVKDIANAPSMRFAWKNGGGVDVGSSAQYWQKLLPDAVKERDGMLEMQYANIALLSAIALAKNFETMDERVARLEKENKELRTKIDMMERGIA